MAHWIDYENHTFFEWHIWIDYENHTFLLHFINFYENRMAVFVLKIAKVACFLYGVVQKLYKNWTIFFHRVGEWDSLNEFKLP